MIKEADFHQSVRGYFAGHLYNAMKKDKAIVCLTADLGFGMLDKIKEDFPERFYNVGAREQAMVGIAVGLALSGLKPVCYSITSFLIKRPYELIDLYLEQEQVNVKLAGGGYDDQYEHDGKTHHFFDLPHFMGFNFPNIEYYHPYIKEETGDLITTMLQSDKPGFMALKR